MAAQDFSITRRRLLAAAGVLGGLAAAQIACAKTAQPPSETLTLSLGALAAARGLYFGSAFDLEAIAIPAYGRLIAHQARFLTTGNSLKFAAVRSDGPEADFADADAIMQFASVTGYPVCGHNLIWNEWNPDWIKAESSARRAYWLDRHIDEMCARYGGRIYAWDVVNEPIWPDHGNPDGLRGGVWYEAMGADYVARAFKRAGAADPRAKLALNESGPEWAGPRADLYRRSVVKIIRRVQDSGARVDIVGMQCHWTRRTPFDPHVFEDFVGLLAEEGVAAFITELDVDDSAMPLDIRTRDARVAAVYSAIVEAALRCPNLKGIVTWDLADSRSWYNDMAGPHLLRWRKPRPLPFDANFSPKPAYHVLARAFSAPVSRAEKQ